jgi:hypothetical protein
MAKKLNATLVDWSGGRLLYRIHPSIYRPSQFNPARTGSARFSPLVAADGSVIPTLYAGTTVDCALMETVFHEVPYGDGFKTISKSAHIARRVLSSLRFQGKLRLIDLRSIALRKLGIARSELIDTDGSQFDRTRSITWTLYEQNEEAQGLIWVSRQDDQAQALVLFEDRFPKAPFTIGFDSRTLLLSDESPCEEVVDLARRLGVLIVP